MKLPCIKVLASAAFVNAFPCIRALLWTCTNFTYLPETLEPKISNSSEILQSPDSNVNMQADLSERVYYPLVLRVV